MTKQELPINITDKTIPTPNPAVVQVIQPKPVNRKQMELFYYVAADIPHGKSPGLVKAMGDRFFLLYQEALDYSIELGFPNVSVYFALADIGKRGEERRTCCEVPDEVIQDLSV
jgi:hypothetical protein